MDRVFVFGAGANRAMSAVTKKKSTASMDTDMEIAPEQVIPPVGGSFVCLITIDRVRHVWAVRQIKPTASKQQQKTAPQPTAAQMQQLQQQQMAAQKAAAAQQSMNQAMQMQSKPVPVSAAAAQTTKTATASVGGGGGDTAMDTGAGAGTAAAAIAGFGEAQNQTSAVDSTFRRINVPAHRLSPLQANWNDLYKPIVEHMKLQIRFNTKKKAIEIRVCRLPSALGSTHHPPQHLTSPYLNR